MENDRSFQSTLRLAFFAGIVASLLFNFAVFGILQVQIGDAGVADGYDELAKGLLEFGTLSYFPDPAPTLLRTPLYPLFLAAAMQIGGESYSIPAQVAQSLLHGCTCVLATLIAFRLGGRRGAKVTAVLCAIHPMLLWYASRLIVESQSTLIYTAIVYLAVRLWQTPSMLRAALLGGGIGMGLWCKADYVPLLPLIPAAIFAADRTRQSLVRAAVVVVIAILTISPWLVRNHQLTGRWPLLQALAGYNLYVSDSFAENAGVSPFGYGELIIRTDRSGLEQARVRGDSLHSRAWIESERDEELTARSLRRYAADPIFFARRVALNAVWIWVLASSWKGSLLIGILQCGLLFAVVVGIQKMRRIQPWSSAFWVPLWIALAYLLPHVLIFSIARYSVIVVPSLIAFAGAAYGEKRFARGNRGGMAA